MLIDIDPSTNDPHYRYKMPKLQIKHESSKTILLNIIEIGNSLKRSPKLIAKYISIKLGTQVIIENNKYGINGRHDLSAIEKIIFNFIKDLVLCKKCNSPETLFLKTSKSKKSGGLKRECLACGTKFLDENNKIVSYIIKNFDNEFNKSDSIYTISGSFEFQSSMDDLGKDSQN
ncbi:Eukaryotic translation initiation factor 5 [Dictyocoela muelleri]|nr:Eukaryotic translation initiation factor 5 [Dictyocoela muelleri]